MKRSLSLPLPCDSDDKASALLTRSSLCSRDAVASEMAFCFFFSPQSAGWVVGAEACQKLGLPHESPLAPNGPVISRDVTLMAPSASANRHFDGMQAASDCTLLFFHHDRQRGGDTWSRGPLDRPTAHSTLI